MKQSFFVLCCFCMAFAHTKAQSLQVIAPQGSQTESSIFLLWDKVDGATAYRIDYGKKQTTSTHQTHITVDHLKPGVEFAFTVTPLNAAGEAVAPKGTATVATRRKQKTINVCTYGVKSGKEHINTRALQSAIDACPKGAVVYIPSGTYYTGSLFLKSDMTLFLEEGAILQGTDNLNDYPLIPNRFEGWEMTTPAALLNGGSIDRSNGRQLRNLSIRGKGSIRGGGRKLTEAMIAYGGERHMGRLICLMNGENITIEGLTIEESPCWTIHYIYCKNVVCKDLVINSEVIRTDGIDPDSSSDCYIYNCTFSNGDDCIAIKSGKNPEGNRINIPTRNVRIVDCNFEKGHGISIGSEMSGGVKDVLIMDCRAGDLLNGLQIKATPQRGGYVEGIRVMDCSIQKIRLFTRLNYNNDGEGASELPIFKDMSFCNLDMTQAPSGQTLIEVNGFDDSRHYTKNITFRNIVLPEQTTIKVRHCSTLLFDEVVTKKNVAPVYEIIESNHIINNAGQTAPSDKQATAETRNLYLNLQRSSRTGILVGHQDDLYRGRGWQNTPGRSDIKELTGEYPAILGSDLGKIELRGELNASWQQFSKQTAHIEQFYRQGGINTISWHMNNPVAPTQGVKSTQDSTIHYLFADPQLLERYNTWMDAAADYLLSLKGDNGEHIPVLLRLFHEHTGSWFWWGKSHCTPEEYIKMWRYTVDYLRNTRHVHNLLTVYCTDVFATHEEYLERYPGDEYVDVLAFDLYDKENWHPAGTYVEKGQKMVKILNEINKDKKKIIALAETGFNKIPIDNWWTESVLPAIKESGLAYAVIWSIGTNNYFSPYKGHPSAPDFLKFYKEKGLFFESDVRKLNIYLPIALSSGTPVNQPVVYTIGDSTMADKAKEKYPETGWGQALPEYLNKEVTVDNQAMDGRSTRSFIVEGRWDPIVKKMKKDDYVIIQFGHNDEKVDTSRGTTIYEFKQNLKRFISDTRSKKATPLLLTPVTRRSFVNGKVTDTHGAYSEAVREVAVEEEVAFIDVHRISEKMITELGPEKSKELFLWIEPGVYAYYPDGAKDNTHFTLAGARKIAGIVAEEMKKMDFPLSKLLK